MRMLTLAIGMAWVMTVSAAEIESRVLTHYIPQDFLETAVRTEAWTEVPINLKGGMRKGDTIRIWAGGSIDRGNGDQPSQYVAGPEVFALPSDMREVERQAGNDEGIACRWRVHRAIHDARHGRRHLHTEAGTTWSTTRAASFHR